MQDLIQQLITQTGSYTLERIPETANELRAWDAADELLINTVLNDYPDLLNKHSREYGQSTLLIINDSFGALAVAFHQYQAESWSDSYISHLATINNLKINNLPENTQLIPSTDNLEHSYDLVIIKIPKSLALLEDQLYRLKPHINNETKIIASAMTKNIHNSTLALFEKIIGTTTTSRATKKARLIYAHNDNIISSKSPYPRTVKDEDVAISLVNHANVFAKDRLDIGTRFLIQNLDKCPAAKHIIDLGCGNGALGIIAKRNQPTAKISFIDESYNAIASARESYFNAYPEDQENTNVDFYISNSLEQFDGEKAELILCNPPFHQVHSISDNIAWEMFKQSREALITDGELWIVGNRHLGYHIKLKKVFGNCRTIASNKKFVILATRKADRLLRKEHAKRK